MYEIELYDTEDGRCPVQEFLDSLEPKMHAKALRTIDLLEANGPLLRDPHSGPMGDGIFELRTKQGSNITRVFYFFLCWSESCSYKWICKEDSKDTKSRD